MTFWLTLAALIGVTITIAVMAAKLGALNRDLDAFVDELERQADNEES